MSTRGDGPLPAAPAPVPLDLLSGALFDQSPVALQLCTPDGRVLRVNQAYRQRWGDGGASIFEDAGLATDDLLPEVRRGFAGEPVVLPPRQAGTAWVRTSITPLRDARGRVQAVTVWHEDITVQQQAEQRRQVAEQQYRGIFEATTDGLIINDIETGVVVEANPAGCRMHGYTRDEFIGLHPARFTHPDYHHHLDEYLGAVRAGRIYRSWLQHMRKDGTLLHVEVLGTGFSFNGRPHALGVVRDVTEQVRTFQALERRVAARTREIERRRQVAEGLRDVLATLNSNRPLEAILDTIVTQCRLLLAAEAVALFRLDDRSGLLSVQAATGLLPELQHGLSIMVGYGAIGRAVQERRPVTVGEHQQGLHPELAWPEDPAQLARFQQVMARYPALLAVPVVMKDEVYGGMALYYSQRRDFSQEDVRLASSLGDQAALAIENARLRAQVEHAAVVAERNRLARELHDSVSQALYGIALGTRTALALAERNPQQVGEPLLYVLSLTAAGMAEMRALIFELRPESLQQEGLVAGLTKQAESLRARHRIEVQAELGEEPPAPIEAKEALYRIAQEALHNIVKHARASQVQLRLCQEDGPLLALEISDNGTGFDPGADYPGHLGLRSMRERAARLGGRVLFESTPGQGTRVRTEIPLP